MFYGDSAGAGRSRADDHSCGLQVEGLHRRTLPVPVAAQIAEPFNTLADPTRLRIVGVPAEHALCVGDLSTAIQMKQPAVSQLRTLRQLGLVTACRDGRHVVYALADAHVHDLFKRALEYIQCDAPSDVHPFQAHRRS